MVLAFIDYSGLVSLLLTCVAAIVEAYNTWLARMAWNPALNESYQAKHATGMAVSPVLRLSLDPAGGEPAAELGIRIRLEDPGRRPVKHHTSPSDKGRPAAVPRTR